jgi:hypothetical protein
MAKIPSPTSSTTSEEHEQMHDVYRQGGVNNKKAPHVVYSEQTCPHPGCVHHLQAIDFRLEAHGKTVHDSLVRAWWNDTGFVGQCPGCENWIHFTIREKKAISQQEATKLPQLPENWHEEAIIL